MTQRRPQAFRLDDSARHCARTRRTRARRAGPVRRGPGAREFRPAGAGRAGVAGAGGGCHGARCSGPRSAASSRWAWASRHAADRRPLRARRVGRHARRRACGVCATCARRGRNEGNLRACAPCPRSKNCRARADATLLSDDRDEARSIVRARPINRRAIPVFARATVALRVSRRQGGEGQGRAPRWRQPSGQ